jgi:hypothetical protein
MKTNRVVWAVCCLAGAATTARADFIRPYGSTPPSVFAMATGGLGVGVGGSLGVVDNRVYSPADSQVDVGLGQRFASAFYSDSTGDSASAKVHANFGSFGLFAQFADVTPSGFNPHPGAVADGGWVDTYTISNPALDGFPGVWTIELHTGGTLFAGDQAGWSIIDIGGSAETVLGIFNSRVEGNARDIPGDFFQAVSDEIFFQVPFTFGTPFEMTIRGVATTTLISVPPAFGSSGTVDFYNTVFWTGNQSVTADGSPVASYQITSASGTDYTQSLEPPSAVPEPGTMAFCTIALAIGVSSRRRSVASLAVRQRTVSRAAVSAHACARYGVRSSR